MPGRYTEVAVKSGSTVHAIKPTRTFFSRRDVTLGSGITSSGSWPRSIE